jgi:LacI family transcriptional regulator
LDNDIPFNENLIIKIEDVDTCEIIIDNYKIKPLMPFCGKRAFAVTSIKTANKIGLNVPKDLAVLSQMALFQNTHSTITTVSQSGIKMGNRAAKC